MRPILLLSYTNRWSEVCFTKLYIWSCSSYCLLDLRVLFSLKTTHFWLIFTSFFYPSRPFFRHFQYRAQTRLSSMLQSVKRRIYSCKNIRVKILAKFRKMHDKMVHYRPFLPIFESHIFSVNQSYLGTQSIVLSGVGVIRQSI